MCVVGLPVDDENRSPRARQLSPCLRLRPHPRPPTSRSFPSRSLARALARIISASRAPPRSFDAESTTCRCARTTTASGASPSPSRCTADGVVVGVVVARVESLCMSFNRTLIGVDGDVISIAVPPARGPDASAAAAAAARVELRRRGGHRRPTDGDRRVGTPW